MTTKEIILHELEQIPASQNVIPQSHESFTFKIAQSEETYQEFKQPPQTPRARGLGGGREHRRKRLHRLALLHH
jgi:hypothetical protein